MFSKNFFGAKFLNLYHSDYNHVHYILRLFDGWVNFPFTISEKNLDYYLLTNWSTHATSQVADWLKT